MSRTFYIVKRRSHSSHANLRLNNFSSVRLHILVNFSVTYWAHVLRKTSIHYISAEFNIFVYPIIWVGVCVCERVGLRKEVRQFSTTSTTTTRCACYCYYTTIAAIVCLLLCSYVFIFLKRIEWEVRDSSSVRPLTRFHTIPRYGRTTTQTHVCRSRENRLLATVSARLKPISR